MTLKERLLEWLIRPERYYISRYMRFLRKEEKYSFKKPCKLLAFWYRGRKNRLGSRLGFIISAGCFEEGLQLEHFGSVIVNPKARIGRDCVFGHFCIIEDDVEIGDGCVFEAHSIVKSGTSADRCRSNIAFTFQISFVYSASVSPRSCAPPL